jgi:hypothetical protein
MYRFEGWEKWELHWDNDRRELGNDERIHENANFERQLIGQNLGSECERIGKPKERKDDKVEGCDDKRTNLL